MTAANTVDVETLAKLLNLDPRRIQQLANDGHIVKAARGRYFLAKSINGYCRFLQGSAGGGADPNSFATQRTRLTKARADLVEMDRAERSGSLVPAEQVEEGWIKIAAIIRARMLALPTKLAPRMATVRTAAEAREILDGEITNALLEIAETAVTVIPDDGPPRHGADGDGDASGAHAAA